MGLNGKHAGYGPVQGHVAFEEAVCGEGLEREQAHIQHEPFGVVGEYGRCPSLAGNLFGTGEQQEERQEQEEQNLSESGRYGGHDDEATNMAKREGGTVPGVAIREVQP